jgi:hypothetical protein
MEAVQLLDPPKLATKVSTTLVNFDGDRCALRRQSSVAGDPPILRELLVVWKDRNDPIRQYHYCIPKWV